MSDDDYPRDLAGYGANPPDPRWPSGARLALSVVMNIEAGGEASPLHGDAHAETLLSEIAAAPPTTEARDLTIESLYAYETRVGVWRLLRLFAEREIPITVFAVGQSLERCPEIAAALGESGHEIACHGWRWIDYRTIEENVEREHIARCAAKIAASTGQKPVGWYTGRPSANTRRLVVEHGGFLYDSDAYDDDLPYWLRVAGATHLVLPYSLDHNDSRMSRAQGLETADEFFHYLRDAFDVLYAEGAESPRMMSVGLHPRLIGRPGRIAGLVRFLDHVAAHDGVWLARRAEIARHWREVHPPRAGQEV